MSEKVTHIYAVWSDWEEGELVVVKAQVVKETPQFYWIPARSHEAFGWHQKIRKQYAQTTRKGALLAYRENMYDKTKGLQEKAADLTAKLDEFNAQFKEELS